MSCAPFWRAFCAVLSVLVLVVPSDDAVVDGSTPLKVTTPRVLRVLPETIGVSCTLKLKVFACAFLQKVLLSNLSYPLLANPEISSYSGISSVNFLNVLIFLGKTVCEYIKRVANCCLAAFNKL